MLISLVVPVRNEAASLRRLIDSIRLQTRHPDEVVFVDGGSTDRTVDLVREIALTDPRFRVVPAGVASPGRGRNIGIAAARHPWIALTDAGMQLDPRWLERLVAAVESDPSVRVVYGNYEPVTNTFFERCAALAYPPPKQDRPGGRMRGPCTPSSLIHRDVWDAVGGFPDLRAAEDLIFMERVAKEGFQIAWAPGATVWWQMQPSLATTFRRFVLYSRHNALAGRQWDWHHGVSRKYMTALPLLVLAGVHSPWWLVLPIGGAAARVLKSIWDRREGRGWLWLLNPVQFAGVALIVATVDLAMFVGWWQACSSRPSTNAPVLL